MSIRLTSNCGLQLSRANTHSLRSSFARTFLTAHQILKPS